jgi:fermentation-respiration switch protein FrsA (DUF1100 family)
VAKVKSLQPGQPVPQILMGLPGTYLMELRDYDPVARAKQLHLPSLFLHGKRDFQVTTKDWMIWQEALAGQRNVTFKEYPLLNHLFMAGDGPAGPAEYLKAGNVDDAVVSDIAAWMTRGKN